jgi:hypothetical protein
MNSSLQGRPESALGARGVQITEFNESKINPEPVVLEDSEILMEQYFISSPFHHEKTQTKVISC